MKKTLHFSSVLQRRNIVNELLMHLFLIIASYPRLLLEVFIRKDMGERYFTVASALTVFAILAAFPVWQEKTTFLNALLANKIWYLFLAGFLYAANRRRLEIKRLPSVFDFARYSLANGDSIIYRFLPVDKFDIRTVQTVIEPGIFFVVGMLLLLFNQYMLGGLLVISSILFSLSYVAAYHYGDHAVMDQIDKIIMGQDMVKAFVDDEDPSQTRGYQFFGRKPVDKENRRKVMNGFLRSEDDVAEAI